MHRALPAIIILLISLSANAQKANIYTSDIDRFWIAFDSVKTTTDTAKQIGFMQRLYLDSASEGLKDFMAARQHSARRHVKNILSYPKFWASIRPLTLELKNQTRDIEDVLTRFKTIYPDFKQPAVYFTIGGLNSGGTTGPDKILIGAEIACANETIDASELSSWLQGVFRDNKNVVYTVAHELAHTQQKKGGKTLLSQSITEGACDFIAELLLQKPIASPYMNYGKENEKKLWQAFEKEMLEQNTKNWLYNSVDAPDGYADLGYFIGYAICRSYYENAADKTRAIRDIIELNYDKESVLTFLKRSKYKGKSR
jgi:hypothetical protein